MAAGCVAGEFPDCSEESSVLAQPTIKARLQKQVSVIRVHVIANPPVVGKHAGRAAGHYSNYTKMTSHAPEETDILCENCGYMLNGLQPSGKCPECGAEIDLSVSERLRKPPLWEAIGDPTPKWL